MHQDQNKVLNGKHLQYRNLKILRGNKTPLMLHSTTLLSSTRALEIFGVNLKYLLVRARNTLLVRAKSHSMLQKPGSAGQCACQLRIKCCVLKSCCSLMEAFPAGQQFLIVNRQLWLGHFV